MPAISTGSSPSCAQSKRRVCTTCPQACAHRDSLSAARGDRLSEAFDRTVPDLVSVGRRGMAARHGEVRQVSVTEIAPRGSSEEFERTPPHDIAAEQCVLGGMLLSKDAISDVLEVIKGADYYR